MSLHYILDGYNIIKSAAYSPQKKLKDSRHGLIKLLEDKRPYGSNKNKVIVVFDGQPDVYSPREESFIEVVFSHGESADDKIKKIVERSRNPRQIVVVSDDRQLTLYVRSLGAVILSTDKFLNKTGIKQKNSKDISRIQLSYSQMDKINEEMKKLWLK